MKKYSKDDVKYDGAANSAKEHCSICIFYIRGGNCRILVGPVSPQGWCQKFLVENPLED